MEKISKSYEKAQLKTLLEVIEHNLASNIDSIYNQAKNLIGTEKQHNLGFLKEKLKGQITEYLKIVVKNIIYQMRMINPENIYMMQTIQRLEKAIK